MVGALEATGAIDQVAEGIKDVTAGNRTRRVYGILWVGGIGSAIVDNIPFTTAMIPVVRDLQQAGGGSGDDAYWWALSLGACFGGNATIIAAAANVAAAGLSERAGTRIGFVAFLKVGLPVTVISMVLASGYIALRYIADLSKEADDARFDSQGNDPRDRAAARRRPGRSSRRKAPRSRACRACRWSRIAASSSAFLASASSWRRLFPGYMGTLSSSAMISRSIDETIERREGCRGGAAARSLTTDHVLVEDDYSDTQLAELFLHHRVLVIPIATNGRVHAAGHPGRLLPRPGRRGWAHLGERAGSRLGSGTRTRSRSTSSSATWIGVGGCALSQVVADDPEVEAALVRGVATDPADEHLVVARRRRAASGRGPRPGCRRRSRPARCSAARGNPPARDPRGFGC